MRRLLSTAAAVAVVVWAMISLSPQAVANEATEPPTATPTTSSQPGVVGDQPSGHGHEAAVEGSAPGSTPAPVTSSALPVPAPDEHSEHGEGHNAASGEQTSAAGDEAAAEEHGGGAAEEHSEAPPVERPRALVLGGFAVFNGAVMLYAALLRRKKAPDHKRRRDARAAALTTNTRTAAKES